MENPNHATQAKPSTDRRAFLAAATSVAAATLFHPPLVLADRKTDPKHPVIGAGEHQYECHHLWGELPEGASYGNASHGVAIDSQGLIYVTHYGRPGSLFVFDPEGRFVRSLGDFHMQNGSALGHGIDIRKEGSDEYIYLSSSSPLAWAKMNLKGEVVWTKGVPKESGKYDNPKSPFRPTNVNFTPDGGYILGDGYGSHYLHRYDKNDKYLGTFGGEGSGKGQFKTPHGQWLDERDGTPKIVVADRANKRLQYFTLEGEHLSFVEGLLFPADIDIRGDVMVVPDLHARVTLYDKENNVIVHLGDDADWIRQVTSPGFPLRSDRSKWQPGKFIHPHDACFDHEGNLFVAEWVVGGRVSKLKKV